MRRDVYLNTIAWQDAQNRFLDFALGPQRRGRLETEAVPATQAIGRVTAVPVFARTSWPHYHAAAMDGVAVASAEVFGASESRPVHLDPDAFVSVDTGDPLPAGRDAVIMVEDLHFDPQGRLEVSNSPAPWENVRPVGEDIVAGEMVVPAGRRLRPADVGAILAAGVTRVQVYRRPRVGIVPSGDELVPAGEATRAGEIPEFDSAILAGLLGEWGAEARVYPPVPDRPEAVAAAMQKVAGECDLVLTIGGSSAGSGDFTARAMSAVGEVFVHGVNTRPGKPVVLGRVGKRPAAGIPGYPVSAVVAMELFVRPLVMTWQGLPPVRRQVIRGRLVRRLASTAGVEEFVRVRVGILPAGVVVSPLSRGAGITTSLVQADGWLVIPASVEGFAEGTEVEVELLRPLEEIEGSLLVTGSHDPALDVLGSLLGERHPGLGISAANVGSLAGLVALGRRECHFAGTHLLDPETGEYNVAYVRRMLPGQEVLLFPLHYRQQGLMVVRGNPKGIGGLADLTRPDVNFVNRQKGAGTRVLLDWLLQQRGISPREVAGYRRELFTHAQVAVAVESGTADVGLGVRSAAQALGLDFIPLAEERYDLALTPETFSDARVQAALEVARGEAFARALEEMGGYRAAAGDPIRLAPS